MRSELNHQIRLSSVSNYLLNDKATLPAALCTAAGYVLCGFEAGIDAFYWIAASVMGVHAVRMRLSASYRGLSFNDLPIEEVRCWERRAVLIGIAVASPLGVGCLIAFGSTADVFAQLVTFMIAMGNMLGILARSFAVRPLVVAQTSIIVMAMAAGLAWSGDPWLVSLAFFAIPFLLIVATLAAKMRADFVRVVHGRVMADQTAGLFDATLTAVPEALVHLDREGRVAVVNRSARVLFRVDLGSAQAGRAFAEIAAESGTFGHAELRQLVALLDDRETDWDRSAKLWSVEGRCYTARVLPSDTQKLLILTDITETERAEKRLADMAREDHLTGLASRAWFVECAERELAEADKGTGARLAVIDLDNFKAVNDTLGHKAGDQVLRELASIIREIMPDTTLATRQGGDEFALFSTGDEARLQAFDRCVVEVLDVFAVKGGNGSVHYAASAGICETRANLDHMFGCADLALYAMKETGRTARTNGEAITQRHRVFDAELRDAHAIRLRTKAALGQALETGEGLYLAYQPIVDPTTGRIVGAEALCRWNDPELGQVPPGLFVPLAEELGAVRRLTEFVLRTATAECARWPALVRVSVNLSAVDLQGSDLPVRVRSALDQSGLDPARLQLEITETQAVRDDSRTRATLRKLNAVGVRIALDDFGTGYSNLSMVESLPIDTVKFDRSLVDRIGEPRPFEFLAGMVDLFSRLELALVIEGVETIEQLDLVAKIGRPVQVQGFVFGRPMPAAQFCDLVERVGAGTDTDGPRSALPVPDAG